MLRPANEALKERLFESATATTVLAFSMIIPCLIALFGVFFADTAKSYLSVYRPVVYLSAEAGEAQAKQLAEEVGKWSGVGEVEVRAPQQAFETLQQRVGEQEVSRLGVTPKMLPYSLVLVPTVPLVGHIDLIAQVEGLPARTHVATVDVPSAKAARTLIAARWLLTAGIVLLFVVLIIGIAQMRILLMQLADDEEKEARLLAFFGAPESGFRRATLTRGVTLGLWAGLLALILLAMMLFIWHYARPAIFGLEDATLGWAWLIIVVPILLGPAAGFLAAGLVNRKRLKRNDTDDLGLEILL
ncbi:permease-like cell division protein FtsX [Bradymonas sediminis]|uniref:FtsX extracellular domain-containing protein n=1 Tax=Bradymonas sediminis TaxID=1548548 RepID=A0A2Z4FI09_9DELT|nr:permease-like cell division protein FtsX [Bradymonas sediminis]AWV88326.1 hypothetical protein DN745_02800 [Bradymonas sediminis]TDP77451.1 cell division protein FtsX [Bradymonas sediminis]